MKTARQHTRDRYEDRSEREEKLGVAMDTLPGKTLRDRTPATAAHWDLPRSKANRLNLAEIFPARAAGPTPHAIPASPLVDFSVFAPGAKSVQIAGTFNGWKPIDLPKGPDGSWHIKMDLKPGAYEYRVIVDNRWQEDPMACDSVANPYGSRNSIRHVA